MTEKTSNGSNFTKMELMLSRRVSCRSTRLFVTRFSSYLVS